MAQDVLDLAGAGAVLGQAGSHGVAQGVYRPVPMCCSRAEPAAVDDVVQESLVELLATAQRLRHPEAAGLAMPDGSQAM